MPQFSVGEVILNGKYRIEKLLGEGAFGEVYLATHQNLKAQRALKVLRKEGESGVGSTVYGHARRRFLQESKLGSQLGAHPRIIQVMDFDEVEDLMVLALEYAPGGSLQKRLESLREEGKPMPVADALRIAVEIAEGLALLHKMDVVHRDLKPGNILFDKEGHAKVADFGLAQVPHSDSRRSVLSMPEPHPGTPGYMSLEQTRPPYDVLPPASDIYAMGAMLFEMLTGRTQYTQRPGTRPSDLRAGVPAELDNLVLRMLADTPRERPWDGAETARLLGAIEQDLAGLRARDAARAAERARLAAEENARQIAAEREQARLAAEAQARRVADEEVRQQAAEREKARLAAEALARQQAAEREKARLAAAEQTRQEVAARASQTPAPAPRQMPWWGWLGGTLLGLAVLGFVFYLVVTAVQALLPGQTATQEPTQAPAAVNQPTQAPVAGAAVPPACTEKGQTWVSPVDGMTLVCVPAGKFSMGSNDGDPDEKPVHDVTLDAYWMDQTEVTNAQYTQCVADGGCVAPGNTGSYTRGSYYGNASFNDYPVIDVNWHQAADYCAWAERGLPSEAQWEKAARGTDGRTYPWGNDTPTCELANFVPGISCLGDTSAVGSYPQGASSYGALDMAGNVWEWVADWYGLYPSGEQNNPAGPASGYGRLLRGGSWVNIGNYLRSSYRWLSPVYRDFDSGFRCARTDDTVNPEQVITPTPTHTPMPTNTPTVASTPINIPIQEPPTVTPLSPILTSTLVPWLCTQKGQTWTSPVDGMTLVCVPESKFSMGTTDDQVNQLVAAHSSWVRSDFDDELVHDVYLDAYWIDQTEVTNAQYASCVAAGGCTAPQRTGSNTHNSYFGNSSYNGYPVILVDWYQAADYCAWAGRRLPTESQWEKAARGTEGWLYPWGDSAPTCNLANFSRFDCADDTTWVGEILAGASPYGAMQMAGNVWEWVADIYGPYPTGEQITLTSFYTPTLILTQAPDTTSYRVLRGGSWNSNAIDVRTSARMSLPPGNFRNDIGFRCAISSP